jgi:cyanophycinase-like exopeptidase
MSAANKTFFDGASFPEDRRASVKCAPQVHLPEQVLDAHFRERRLEDVP